MKRLRYITVLCALLAGTLWSCDDSDSEVKDKYHSITAAPNEFCRIDVQQKEVAGKQVQATITLLDPTREITSVTCNDEPCTFVSGNGEEFRYEFTMPDEHVLLTAETARRAPDTYSIRAVENNYYGIDAPNSAGVGELVRVKVSVSEVIFKVGAVRFNDEPCAYISDDGLEFIYEFTMPGEDVTLTAELEEDLHLITPVQGRHTTLAILNCHYNYGTPEHVIQATAFELVRYTVDAELGYDLTHAALSQSGQRIEAEYKPDDEEYGACWRVPMPDEPLSIETSATEKTTYAGQAFLGEYRGCEIRTPESHLVTAAAPTLTMEMKANTVFNVRSEDSHAFDFDGCYEYDQTEGRFSYLKKFCKKTFGISGSMLDKDALITVEDVVKGVSVPVYTYFVSKEDFGYTCASDTYATRYLLEITRNTGKIYYVAEPGYYSIKRAEVRFDEGSSIASPCSALITVDGSPLLRYTLASEGAVPVFTYKGREAGTYTDQNGSGPDLILDGFGNGTLGATQGEYTVEKGVVSFTADGKTVKYLIDATAHTYSETQADDSWDGPVHLYAQSDYGFNKDLSSDWIKGYVYVDMDRDYSGNAKPGYALIKLFVPERFGSRDEIVGDCVPYVYDKSAGTLVLSQVLQGKSDDWGQVRYDVNFTVSADQTLTFTTEYIYSMSTPNKYIQVLGLELQQAPEE